MHSIKDLVVVDAGFANRMNGVMSNLDATILWRADANCGATWYDLFLTKHDVLSSTSGLEVEKQRHGGCMFTGDKERAREWLRTLEPSKEVRDRMPDLSLVREGWYVRALYPGYPIGQKLHIPEGSFLATDSSELRKQHGKCVMVSDVPATLNDRDVRTREHVICAVADWFTLLHCEVVHSYGVPFITYDLKHSTFLDARRILGLTVIDH